MFDSKNLVNPHLAGDSFFEKRSSRGILLLHGLTATTNSVRPLASRLGELDWTISAPLLPGHGESLEKLSTTNWRDWATQVEQCWHQLNDSCDEAFIAGESAGGLLALWLACLQTIRPKGLVLVAPALQLNLPNWKRQLIWLLSFFNCIGFTHPLSHAFSVINFSIEPMVTVPCPDCSITQFPSHSRSCGHILPQTSGMLFVLCDNL